MDDLNAKLNINRLGHLIKMSPNTIACYITSRLVRIPPNFKLLGSKKPLQFDETDSEFLQNCAAAADAMPDKSAAKK